MALHRVVLSGGLALGDEWSSSFHCDVIGVSTVALTAGAVKDALEDNWSTIASSYYSGTTLNRISVYEIPITGGPATDQAEETVTLAGSSSSVPVPANVAVVATLLTGAPGRSRRGRMYWPAFQSSALDTTGRIEAPFPSNLATFLADTFGQINIAGTRTVGVYSRTNASISDVQAVSVGDVWDTMRSRRNAVTENRVSVNVSTV